MTMLLDDYDGEFLGYHAYNNWGDGYGGSDGDGCIALANGFGDGLNGYGYYGNGNDDLIEAGDHEGNGISFVTTVMPLKAWTASTISDR